ncbi:hypothetical protein CFOL_v3_23116, partial [Cephalotus follicularis]
DNQKPPTIYITRIAVDALIKPELTIKSCRISNPPEDMEIDIPSRLLVMSLLRFRCVSKYWCSLLQTPSFKTQQYLKQTSLHNTNANSSVFLYGPRDSVDPLHLYMLVHTLIFKQVIDLLFPLEDVGYRNGLICLCNHNDIIL